MLNLVLVQLLKVASTTMLMHQLQSLQKTYQQSKRNEKIIAENLEIERKMLVVQKRKQSMKKLAMNTN